MFLLLPLMLLAFASASQAQAAPSDRQSEQPPLELSRPIRSWEFLPVVGQRAALFGRETGQLEAWVYPLKIFRDFHLRFLLANRTVPAEAMARTLIVRPESATIVYGGDDFSVRETLFVPVHEQGAILTFDVDTAEPFEIEADFTEAFQLEWPAALGATYYNWEPRMAAYVFGEETKKYVAIVGSPTAAGPFFAYDDNYSKSEENSFRLGRVERGHQTTRIVIAASTQGEPDAINIYHRLLNTSADLEHDSAAYYRDYLDRTTRISVPDPQLEQAYDWARISTIQGLVQNSGLGTGLVAGYRTSGTSQRPGFAWFFGRDSLWTSFALNAEGDFSTTKEAIAFVAQFQRDDGRIPHEIAQSANLLDWFHAYPYAFASADATPLFIIAVDDYVRESGDVEFARTNWDRLTKAYSFLRSTYDDQGFPRNFGVGHGWVEGGPLLPVQSEYYQSGLGLEAIRALADLATLTGKNDMGRELTQAFDQQRIKVEQAFWIKDPGIYAYALDREHHPVAETSVLATVPMWFGLADPKRASHMIDHLAAPDIAADWGMRIIASRSVHYNGGGYHFGSVWPLFTGWAAVGEYRYHRADAAYANLRSNSLLALDGALGHVTEVLSGDVFESLSTASPHQIWSAAMVISPVLRGLFGLEANAAANRLTLAPHLPASWGSFVLSDVKIGSTAVDLSFHREPNEITLEVKTSAAITEGKAASPGPGETEASSAATLVFSPALSPRTEVLSAELNGHHIAYHVTRSDTDQHVEIEVPVSTNIDRLRLRLKNDFALSYDNPLPELASASQALRIVSENWNDAHTELTMNVAGLPGHHYALNVWNPAQIATVDGTTFKPESASGEYGCGAHTPVRDCSVLRLDFPPAATGASSTGFVTRSLVLRFQSKN